MTSTATSVSGTRWASCSVCRPMCSVNLADSLTLEATPPFEPRRSLNGPLTRRPLPSAGNACRFVRRFALYMQAEDECYEVPSTAAFGHPRRRRRMPHIYTSDEVDALLRAAAQLAPGHSIRPVTYVALLSLLFSSGLRISEALALQIDDTMGDALLVRKTKFRKSRLVPLHPTARAGLDRYIAQRQQVAARDRSVFVSLGGTGLRYATAYGTFLHIARSAGLRAGPGLPGPRLHDARHTFAVRALESCRGGASEITRHILALSTYLGHAHPSDTYWYLQATPRLMAGIACSGETLFTGGRA